MSRAGRCFSAGRPQKPFVQFSPTGIFARKHLTDPRATDTEHYALKLANQLNYNNPAYTYNGEMAPKFYGYSGYGYDGNALGFNTVTNVKEFTPALYIVSGTQETQKWTYVNTSEEAQPPGTNAGLQKKFEAVPTPTASQFSIPQITPGGTDKEICIYRPSTDEYWEVFGFRGEPGEYRFRNGAYQENASKWSGVFPTLEGGVVWGARATGLAAIGGSILYQDLIEVLHGGKIKHALSMAIQIAQGPDDAAFRAPAKRNDARENGYKEFENNKKEKVTNPAYGTVDQVKEGAWFCFPATSKASEHGITKPLEVAVYEAIREYGLVINDSGGTCALSMEYWASLGSPYSYAKCSPVYEAKGTVFKTVNEDVPASWHEPASALPRLEEEIVGTESILTKQPWQDLELLEEFAE